MTVNSLSIKLSNRVGDKVAGGTTDGKRFTSSQRLEALNAATRWTVSAILGRSTPTRKAHELLNELIKKTTKSLNTSGTSLTDLRCAANGVLYVAPEISGERRPAVERRVDELQAIRNQYLRGSDDDPTYYIMDGKLYLEITVGSYPVLTDIHYVEIPKELVNIGETISTTATFPLNDLLAEPVLTAAEAHLYKETYDFDRVETGRKMFTFQIDELVHGAQADEDTLGGVEK